MGLLPRIASLLTTLALLAMAAAPAAAQEPSPCRLDLPAAAPGPEYNLMAHLFRNGPDDDARAFLGPQYGGLWLQPRDHGLYVGIAPGPITADQAYAYLLGRIDAHYDGPAEALLRDHLHVAPQPYGETELRWNQIQIILALDAAGLGRSAAIGVGCQLSDAFRVQVELYNTLSPEKVARAREVLAPWGDRVVVVQADFGPPTPRGPIVLHLEARTRDLVSRPSCATRRTTVKLLPSVRRKVTRLTLTVGRAQRTVPRSRYRQPLPVRTKTGGTTPVRVEATMKSGATIRQTFRLRACR
jgi:hypothetical protein